MKLKSKPLTLLIALALSAGASYADYRFTFKQTGVSAPVEDGQAGAPVISDINPAGLPLTGGSVSLSGSGFIDGATVNIGATPVTVDFVGVDSILFQAPELAEGVYDVVVTNPDAQSATLPSSLSYLPAPAPSALSENSGTNAGGDVLLLTGDHFTSNVSVFFDGAPATGIAFTDSTSLSLETPAGDIGTVDVTVTNEYGSGILAGAFTYVDPAVVSLPNGDASQAFNTPTHPVTWDPNRGYYSSNDAWTGTTAYLNAPNPQDIVNVQITSTGYFNSPSNCTGRSTVELDLDDGTIIYLGTADPWVDPAEGVNGWPGSADTPIRVYDNIINETYSYAVPAERTISAIRLISARIPGTNSCQRGVKDIQLTYNSPQ